MKFIKIVNFVLLFSIILSQASLGSEELFRRVRGEQIILSLPGVKGEVLLKNLFALLYRNSGVLTSKDLATLSSFAGTNLADHKLDEGEFKAFVKEVSTISGKEISPDYDYYTDCYESPSHSYDFGDFLSLFEQHFLRLLNTSGRMEPVFKFVEGLAAAEYIAVESKHELGTYAENQLEEAYGETEKPAVFDPIGWHKWLLTGDKGIAGKVGTLNNNYSWNSLNSENKDFIMACVYILLINRGIVNTPSLLSILSQDPETQDALIRVRKAIEVMFLEQGLKAKVLSLIPIKKFSENFLRP